MVNYVADNTGRFPQRPYYPQEELDRECEQIIGDFLKGLYGHAHYPVITDDLTKLIERDAEDLDLYADLSIYGDDVEGVTEFRKGHKPRVMISAALSNDERRENRLRTTLTHEYGHVRFHAYLWELTPSSPGGSKDRPHPDKVICKRGSITGAAQSDWMEWQAGYICGALLMPKSAVLQLARELPEASKPVAVGTPEAGSLINQITKTFLVSEDAARVRLLKLSLLSES
ncbi:MAG: hypothetical protein WBG92_16225 [Thiohalocapsa sp.]